MCPAAGPRPVAMSAHEDGLQAEAAPWSSMRGRNTCTLSSRACGGCRGKIDWIAAARVDASDSSHSAGDRSAINAPLATRAAIATPCRQSAIASCAAARRRASAASLVPCAGRVDTCESLQKRVCGAAARKGTQTRAASLSAPMASKASAAVGPTPGPSTVETASGCRLFVRAHAATLA